MGQRGQSKRQAARAKQRREAGKIDLLERRTLRPGWRIRRETGSAYDHLVATGEVNRGAWAEVVQELIDQEAEARNRKHGSKLAFAKRVGVSERTVGTWLRGLVDVKESSIRGVAIAYDLDVMETLIRVGLYTTEQMPYQPTAEEIDEEQRTVIESDLDDETKKAIIDELEAMRQHDERLLEEQRERDKQRRLREIAWRIEQARSTTA